MDALIFDMDGTLWDAVDSYCAVWDATRRETGDTRPVTRDQLLGLMGKPLDAILEALGGAEGCEPGDFMARLARNEAAMMPRLGGRLYDGVRTTLQALHDRGLPLMMVSNCSASGLDNFLDFTGLRPLMTAWRSHGGTGLDKAANMRALCERYNLRDACYVGDIQADCDDTHRAGLRFVWAAYGFGHVADPDYTIYNFSDLTDLWN